MIEINKINKLLLIMMLVVTSVNLHAYTKYTVLDSLKNELEKQKVDSDKVALQVIIAKHIGVNDSKKAISFYTKAYNLSDSIKFVKGQIESSYYRARHHLHERDYNQAIEYLQRALQLQIHSEHNNHLINTYLSLGSAYMYTGNYTLSEKYFNQGVEVSLAQNNYRAHADILKNKGILFVYKGNYEISIDLFKEAIQLYNKINDGKGQADCYTNIGVVHNYMGNHLKSVDFQIKAIETYREVGLKSFLAKGLNNLGVSYDDLNRYDDAIECYTEALAIQIELNDKKGISMCYNNIGEVYRDKGDYAKAIEFYEKSLRIDKELEDIEGMAICQLNIGAVHFAQQNNNKAHKYYAEALQNANKVGEKRIVANVLNAIGELLLKQEKYDQAISQLEEAIEISMAIVEKSEEARSNFLLGEVFRGQKQFADAMGYYKKALEVHEELGEIGEASMDNIRLGEALIGLGYTSKAIGYIEHGLQEAEQLGIIENVRLAAEILASAYAEKGDFKTAYHNLALYKRLHDTIFTIESQKQIHIVESRFELERKDAELQLQKAELDKQDAELKQQLILQKSLIGGIVAIFMVVVLIVIGYLRIHKAKNIISEQKDQITEKNEELKLSNEELRATVETVNEQKYEIERATKELTDSIHYAQYIQKAILPKKQSLSSKTSDHFVLYKPKDIVSGDFYWTTEIEGKTIIAAADCTGHGVPGAFMSMLGVSFLNDIVNKEYITHTGVILRRLRKEIINALQQKGVLGEQRDGMDIAICSIDFETMELQFSGAHNPLYIVRNREQVPITEVNAVEFENNILYELKGDRMPIALYEKMDRFTDRTIKLFNGDRLYMFSDGYVDQFGGKDGKRFKSRAFKEVLLRNCEINMHDQKCALEAIFLNWKGVYEQIDDVMVVGLKI